MPLCLRNALYCIIDLLWQIPGSCKQAGGVWHLPWFIHRVPRPFWLPEARAACFQCWILQQYPGCSQVYLQGNTEEKLTCLGVCDQICCDSYTCYPMPLQGCSRVLLVEKDRREFLKKMRQPRAEPLAKLALMKKVRDKCKLSRCPWCGYINGKLPSNTPFSLMFLVTYKFPLGIPSNELVVDVQV